MQKVSSCLKMSLSVGAQMRGTEVKFKSDGLQVIGGGSVLRVSGQDITRTHLMWVFNHI